MGCYRFFFLFTQRLSERYGDLFDSESEGDDDKFSSGGNFNKKWGGYISLSVLAGNDVTRFEAVTKLTMHECLTFLAYKKDVNAMELMQAKQMNRVQ